MMMMRLSACMLSVFFSVLGTQMSTIAAADSEQADQTAAISAALNMAAALPSLTHQRRNLQFEEGICLNETHVDFSDDDGEFEKIIFAPEYEPACSCTNESNVEEVFGDFEAQFGNSKNITAILESLNKGLALLEVLGEYSCTNGCETCLENGTTCGIFSTTTREYTKGKEGNLTFLFFLEFNETDADSFTKALTESLGVEYYTETCMHYTTMSGGEPSGKTCYGIDLDQSLPESGDTPCFITYNGHRCSSCTLEVSSSNDCVVADCTNILDGANINTCTGQGLIGPFMPVMYVTEEITPNEVTKGQCGITPPAYPTPAPTRVVPVTTTPPDSGSSDDDSGATVPFSTTTTHLVVTTTTLIMLGLFTA